MSLKFKEEKVENLKNCSCKGIRSCLICEEKKEIQFIKNNSEFKKEENNQEKKEHVYVFCDFCGKAWKEGKNHPDHSGNPILFPGIGIYRNFISESEEEFLVKEIEKIPFVDSQSGRRKQDFGPKVNFKKQKIKCDSFSGLPAFSRFIVERFTSLDSLTDFTPVELCNLEYEPERGSAIDPHFDDFWIWGERLITLNLLSDTSLTMTIDALPDHLSHHQLDLLNTEVHVPLPRRSLVVVFGAARYDWKHCIRRGDIVRRRLAMTFRELTPEFRPGGAHYEEVGLPLVETALTYRGISLGEATQKQKDKEILKK